MSFLAEASMIKFAKSNVGGRRPHKQGEGAADHRVVRAGWLRVQVRENVPRLELNMHADTM